MKGGSVKTTIIGLSTIALAGWISAPINVEAAEDSDSSLFASEDNQTLDEPITTDEDTQDTQVTQEIPDDFEMAPQAIEEEPVNANVGEIVAADDNRDTDTSSYVATVIQYYYAPTAVLSEGEHISGFTASDNNGEYVTVSYDVLDEYGNYIRTVTADYGYDIDSETGEIRIYDSDIYYEYTDANGDTVTLTEDEKSEIDEQGGIEIDKYYTADGYYIPRYTDTDVNYSGEIAHDTGYSDAKAVAQGKSELENSYDDMESHYNSTAKFLQGWKTLVRGDTLYTLDLYYNVEYDKVERVTIPEEYSDIEEYIEFIKANGGIVLGTYTGQLVEYITIVRGYALSDTIKETFYSSYSEIIDAITSQAKDENNGATGYDQDNSLITVTENIVYATFNRIRQNSANPIFTSTSSHYTSFINRLRTLIAGSNDSASQLSEALDDYYITLSSDSVSISDGYDYSSYNTFTVLPEEYILEDDEENNAEEEISVISFLPSHTSNDRAGSNAEGTGSLDIDTYEKTLEDLGRGIVEILDEEVPTAITIAGLLARGKWFVGLAGVSVAGVGVSLIEAKRRAAVKLIDKLNQ